WWNDTPQYDGLYDNQGQVRPAYHAFKLLSLIKGARLPVDGPNAAVHALAVKAGPRIHVLVWSFSEKEKSEPVDVLLHFSGVTSGQFRLTRLDPTNRIAPLELLETGDLAKAPGGTLRFQLKPYEIRWVFVE